MFPKYGIYISETKNDHRFELIPTVCFSTFSKWLCHFQKWPCHFRKWPCHFRKWPCHFPKNVRAISENGRAIFENGSASIKMTVKLKKFREITSDDDFQRINAW